MAGTTANGAETIKADAVTVRRLATELLDQTMSLPKELSVRKTLPRTVFDDARTAMLGALIKLIGTERAATAEAAELKRQQQVAAYKKAADEAELGRLSGIITLQDEQGQALDKLHAVSGLIISELSARLGWRLTSSRWETHSDGKGIQNKLWFGSIYLVVVPHLQQLLITAPGMNQQVILIDETDGLTTAGRLVLRGFLYYRSLDDEARAALPREELEAYYSAEDSSVAMDSQDGSRQLT